jgi:hypothetical protein
VLGRGCVISGKVASDVKAWGSEYWRSWYLSEKWAADGEGVDWGRGDPSSFWEFPT